MSDACFASLADCIPACGLEGNQWEQHPKYCVSGGGGSIATKKDHHGVMGNWQFSPWKDWHNTLVTDRVMDSGIHRISLKYTVPTLQTLSAMIGTPLNQAGTYSPPLPLLCHLVDNFFVPAAVDRVECRAMFGVVLDGAPRDKPPINGICWLIQDSKGTYFLGNQNFVPSTAGPEYARATHVAGAIEAGQVLSMQLNMERGTLKFWVDGKPHGPGFTKVDIRSATTCESDVGGASQSCERLRLRWAATVTKIGMSVHIVPTPALDEVHHGAVGAPTEFVSALGHISLGPFDDV